MSSLSSPFAHHDPLAQATDALVDSAALGRLEPLREAIAAGGDPNFMRLDISPALAAVSNEHLECLRLVVDAGGGGDLPNRMGWTAFHEASIKEDVQFLEVLLSSEFEQDLSPRDRQGWTPLRAAIEYGRLEAVSQLLTASPKQMDIVDLQNVSPVMAAARKRNVFLMTLLLEAGADLSVEDREGKNIAHYVEGWSEGEELLVGRNLVATPIAPRAIAVEPLSEPVTEGGSVQSAANPFGLGGMKKIRKGP